MKNTKLYKHTCPQCGEEYESIKSKQKYCSIECRNKGYTGRESSRLVRSNSVFEGDMDNFKAYFLGLIHSDGCIQSKASRREYINLSLNEEDIMTRLNNKICPEKKLTKYRHHNGATDTYTFHYYNEYDLEYLSSQGIVRNKSLITRMPELDEKFISHFIRGVFDGDGCVYNNPTTTYYKGIKKTYNYPAVSFTTGSVHFANELAKELEQFGPKILKDSRSKDPKVNDCYYVKITNKKGIVEFFEWLYKDKDEWYLDRKYNKFTEVI